MPLAVPAGEEGGQLRLLVVDESRVLPWLVRRLAGEAVEVVSASTFDEALAALDATVDAVVVSVPPAHLPWPAFQHACARRHPVVPVLYESCIATHLGALGLDPLEGWAEVLRKPASRGDLERALARLVEASRAGRDAQRSEEFPFALPNPG